MNCPNCGKKISEGSVFCGKCGTNLSALEPLATPVCSDKKDIEIGDNKSRETKYSFYVIIPFLILILCMGIGAFKAFNLFKGTDTAFVTLSEGKYELSKKLAKPQFVDISTSKSESYNTLNVSFSPDKKSLYFYIKYDSYTNTGTLCKADYLKLRNNKNNENLIQIISSNVKLGLTFLEDGTCLFLNNDNNLYYYNGKEATLIQGSVNRFFKDMKDHTKRILVETLDEEDNYTLYGIPLDNISDKRKIASDYKYVYDAYDYSNIFLIGGEQNDDELYVVDFDGNAQKIGENVEICTIEKGKAYFTSANGTNLSLYDYVEDRYAKKDEEVKSPELEDYSYPIYEYKMLDSSDRENDYDTLYTSCTKPVYFLQDLFFSFSIEEGIENEKFIEEKVKYYQEFYDKYKSSENEDGYIVITDNVKKDLIELVKHTGTGYENEWMELCFNKEESGIGYNYDQYDHDLETYNAIENRIELRKELKSTENSYRVKTLYCYEDNKLSVICDDVLDTKTFRNSIIYNTKDMINSSVLIENITSTNDVYEMFYLRNDQDNWIVSTKGYGNFKITDTAFNGLDSADDNLSDLYIYDKYAYLISAEGKLYKASLKDGLIEGLDLVVDDVDVLGENEKCIYFTSQEYMNGEYSYADLYKIENGDMKCLAKDILKNTILIYPDETICTYTGGDSENGFELTMYTSDGEKERIANDVTQYMRIDSSNILYISHNDLYLYNGNKNEMLHPDVDMFWCAQEMKVAFETIYN